MIIIMKRQSCEENVTKITEYLFSEGMKVQVNSGVECTVLGVLGDTHRLDRDSISMFEGVERIVPVQEPYKKANRKFHPADSVVRVGDADIGGGEFFVMAGPCSVESKDQIIDVATAIKSAGAKILRGGAFKPRTSPYAFQGLELEGLALLEEARNKTGLPIVTEIMSQRYLELFEQKVDIIQVGARNMQNFDLLKELGRINKPILLKRGFSSTIEELLMSAEYIMSEGNQRVILCERGIRTFETYTRNTLDISAIPILKRLSHLPVVVDPSHAAGKSWLVLPLSLAAMSAGADGLIIEVHNDPARAICDGPQSITPSEFSQLMTQLNSLANTVKLSHLWKSE